MLLKCFGQFNGSPRRRYSEIEMCHSWPESNSMKKILRYAVIYRRKRKLTIRMNNNTMSMLWWCNQKEETSCNNVSFIQINNLSKNEQQWTYMWMYVCATAFCFAWIILSKSESDEAERRNDDECQIILQRNKLWCISFSIFFSQKVWITCSIWEQNIIMM